MHKVNGIIGTQPQIFLSSKLDNELGHSFGSIVMGSRWGKSYCGSYQRQQKFEA